MKKIGLYLNSIIGGGVYQYNLSILNAVKELPSDKYETVICYSNSNWKKYFGEENINAIEINNTFLSKIWFQSPRPLSAWRRISPYIDQFSKSIISKSCNLWIFPSQDIWSYSLPINAMVTVHDLMHRYENRFPETSSKRIYKKRERHYSRISTFAKSILVDSEIGKNQMIESYNTNPKKLFILPYIPPQYIFKKNTDIDIQKIYGLPQKYIFYPAQFWLHKNHIKLIEAISVVKKQYPNVFLVLVGSKKNGYDSIINYINKLNLSQNIKILNYVPNEHIPELYKTARAMVMPTFYGPTNIPPLEAMALGCPVAVSNIYAMPDQIGKAGLVFNPNSINDIVNILKTLWTNDILVKILVKRGFKKSEDWQQHHFNLKFQKIISRVLEIN